MTVLTATRPNPSAFSAMVGDDHAIHHSDLPQWRADHRDRGIGGFHRRLLHPVARIHGNRSIGGMSSYGQFLMPLIALQAVYFAAMSTAFRSANDRCPASSGDMARCRSLR